MTSPNNDILATLSRLQTKFASHKWSQQETDILNSASRRAAYSILIGTSLGSFLGHKFSQKLKFTKLLPKIGTIFGFGVIGFYTGLFQGVEMAKACVLKQGEGTGLLKTLKEFAAEERARMFPGMPLPLSAYDDEDSNTERGDFKRSTEDFRMNTTNTATKPVKYNKYGDPVEE